MSAAGRLQPWRREALRESLLVLVAAILACAAGAVALNGLRGDDYSSTAVVTGEGASIELARSDEVARAALGRARAREPASALLSHSDVELESDGDVAFTVRAERPAAARRLADAYARAYVASLPRRAGARARPARPAERSGGILGPLLAGAGIGLVTGLLLVFVREAFDVRRTSSRALGPRIGARELGQVPAVSGAIEQPAGVAALDEPEGATAAAYGRVAARVADEAERTSARTLVVAGAVPDDNGDHVAANLAGSLAAAGSRVAVVELEPGRAGLRRLFALERGPGLAEVIRGEAILGEALARPPGAERLTVLTAGEGRDRGSAADVLDALAATHDLVIVATPPLLRGRAAKLPPADALLLAINLHRVRRSRWPTLERVIRRLRLRVLGYVVVGAAVSEPLGRSPERRVPG